MRRRLKAPRGQTETGDIALTGCDRSAPGLSRVHMAHDPMSRKNNKAASRLLVVSHVVHYEYADRFYAYGPYGREIDIWADLFDHVIIAAPLRREEPPGDCLPFARANITISAQLETGGESLGAKALQALLIPAHLWKLGLAMARADVLHVRCPGNLGLLGALLAPLFSRRIVAKYAGQWDSSAPARFTFRLQRSILSSWWWRHGIVCVYGDWPNRPPQVVPFFTSMMSAEQVRAAKEAADRKSLELPVRIMYSGRLSPQKGVDLLLRALESVSTRGVPFELSVIGDGPERQHLEKIAADAGLRDRVHFYGALPFDHVMAHYGKAHILALASLSEGWPKALVEAMCHGVVCIGTETGLLPWMLTGRGETFPAGDIEALANKIVETASDPRRYQELSRNASRWSQRYSIEGLREALRTLLSSRWDHSPSANDEADGDYVTKNSERKLGYGSETGSHYV